jgi:hypothetical protein
MAFLDNSGDIILDAVLTDVGRKRMAQGQFSISKFAIGDDEIDYALYNKNHPSGSAYYDLEILQTPILEAFTQINANINYGLKSYARQDLLYLPSIKMNNLMGRAVQTSSVGVTYLADPNSFASDDVPVTTKLTTDLGSNLSIMISADDSDKILMIETGLDSGNDPVGSSTNQSNFIIANDLLENNFTVSYNSKFISQVRGPDGNVDFSNVTGTGAASLTTGFIGADATVSSTTVGEFHDATVRGVLNRVYRSVGSGGSDTALNYSVMRGPRGTFTLLGLSINPDIPTSDYQEFGKTGQTQGSGASTQTYDYIDTSIFVTGNNTGVSMQIPIRIIRIAA